MSVVATTAFGMFSGAATAANPPKPKITFKASPAKVTNTSGVVNLNYTVANAGACVIANNPSAGIYTDISIACDTTPTGTQQLVLPRNSGTKPVKYTFTMTAFGSATKSKKAKVTVMPGAGRAPLSGVTQLAATPMNNCAVLDTGHVDCWGDNGLGSIGNGTLAGPQTCLGSQPCADRPTPVVDTTGSGLLSNVVQLAADNEATYCARRSDGSVVCWGPQFFDELGLDPPPPVCNAAYPCSPTPVVVLDGSTPATRAIDIEADTTQAFCALMADGHVDCWGYGGDSNAGNGAASWPNQPSPVVAVGFDNWNVGECSPGCALPPPLTGVAHLSAGGIGFCAVLDNTGVVCWGFHRYGNLGLGSMTGTTSCHGEGAGAGDCADAPHDVVTADQQRLTGIAKVVPLGPYGWCAVTTSGGADCWGDAQFGELGNGSIDDPEGCPYGPCLPWAVPVVDPSGTGALSGVADVVAGTGFYGNLSPSVCAVLSSGGVDCWGFGAYGALGNGGGALSVTPIPIPAPDGSGPLGGVTQVVSNAGGGYCAAASGGLVCWGKWNGSTATPTAISGIGGTGVLQGVTSVATAPDEGTAGVCAILTGGRLACLGSYNNVGSLGLGGTEQWRVSGPAPTPSSPFNSPMLVIAPA